MPAPNLLVVASPLHAHSACCVLNLVAAPQAQENGGLVAHL